MKHLRRSAAAIADIEDCLELSLQDFGEKAAARYAELLSVALEGILQDTDLLGSFAYEELPHIRMVHLRHFRSRAKIGGKMVKKPRHFIVYCAVDEEIVILRILHERMEIEQHLGEERE